MRARSEQLTGPLLILYPVQLLGPDNPLTVNNPIINSDQLRASGLKTLNFRRIRGDIIETYKILSGKYDRR